MGKGIINYDAATTNELLDYVKEIKEGGGINLDAPKDGNLYGQQNGEWKQAQEKLVNGETIKTLNGVPVLGSGNIDVAPTIGENGNWFINGEDTGKPAKGKDGADGVSLGEIALVQETGTDSGSENKVMSQKAVSEKFSELDALSGQIQDIKSIIGAELLNPFDSIYKTGYIINAQGQETSLPGAAISNNIKVIMPTIKLSIKFRLAPQGGSYVRIHGYDDSDTWVEQVGFILVQDTEEHEINLSINSKVYNLKVSCPGFNNLDYCTITTEEVVDNTAREMAEQNANTIKNLTTEVRLNPFDSIYKAGYIIDAQGQETSLTGAVISNNIKVTVSTIKLTVKFKLAPQEGYYVRIHGYDDSDTWVKQIGFILVQDTEEHEINLSINSKVYNLKVSCPGFNNLDYCTITTGGIVDNTAREMAEQNAIKSKIYIQAVEQGLLTSTNDVYSLYDDLLNKNPFYVKKEILFESLDGDTDNSIYEYTFTIGNYNEKRATGYSQDAEEQKKKILITTGVHGYERSSVMGTYLFCKALVECAPSLLTLRSCYEIKVIPIVTPTSYNTNSRVNNNGVNINRNFDARWSLNTSAENNSGTEPNNQDETKTVISWLDKNDALCLIDHHNSLISKEVAYIGIDPESSDLENLKQKMKIGMAKCSSYWEAFNKIDTDKIYYYYGTHTINGSLYGYAALQCNINSMIVESAWDQNNTGKDSNYSIAVCAEVIGNVVNSIVE